MLDAMTCRQRVLPRDTLNSNSDALPMDTDAAPEIRCNSASAEPPELLARVDHAVVSLSGRRALDDVSLQLRTGEHLVLRGGNGAGKSTLLRLLRGEQRPDQKNGGRVFWYEAGVPDASPLTGRSMTALVSAAAQERITARGWNITGEELVIGGLADTVFIRPEEAVAHAETAARTAAELGAEAFLTCPVPTLSQGQLRLLLIARALVRRPALLLLDEALDGLDASARDRVWDALRRAGAFSTLVVSTHRPETLPAWIRREVRLQDGRIIADAQPIAPETPPVVSSKLPVARCTTNRSQGVDIRTCNATVYVDGTPVLHEINWHIEPGQNWVVSGGNGAGKSTLLRLLAGDEHAAAGGSVRRILPRRGGEVRALDDIRRSIRLVSDLQQAVYGYDLSGLELVCSGLDNTTGVYRDFSAAEREQARACLNRLDAIRLAGKTMRSCSTGELRRLFLARALMGDPELLLLDEPCSGLDPETRNLFLRLIENLAVQGLQFVLVTHNDTELIPSVTHMLRLNKGRVDHAGSR